MLSRNPPFTKAAESPLCTEALVDQLWKLMNSGKTNWELQNRLMETSLDLLKPRTVMMMLVSFSMTDKNSRQE